MRTGAEKGKSIEIESSVQIELDISYPVGSPSGR